MNLLAAIFRFLYRRTNQVKPYPDPKARFKIGEKVGFVGFDMVGLRVEGGQGHVINGPRIDDIYDCFSYDYNAVVHVTQGQMIKRGK